MLGDGSIHKNSATRNSRFEMSFGEKYPFFAKSLGDLFFNYMKKYNPISELLLKQKYKILKITIINNLKNKCIKIRLFFELRLKVKHRKLK